VAGRDQNSKEDEISPFISTSVRLNNTDIFVCKKRSKMEETAQNFEKRFFIYRS
jgi:hypothetical protein